MGHDPKRWHAKPQDSRLLKVGERLAADTLAAERAGIVPIDDAWLNDLPDAEDVALPEAVDEVLVHVVKR